MTGRFTIRAYGSQDAPAMAQLYYDSVRSLGVRSYDEAQVRAWAPAPVDPSVVRARAEDGRTTLVAVDREGRVSGYGDLEADGHIDHLYCHPDAAGLGLGSALLEGLLAQAAVAQMDRLFVEASELAKPVFLRGGFVLIRRRDFEMRGVAIYNYAMQKILRRPGASIEAAAEA